MIIHIVSDKIKYNHTVSDTETVVRLSRIYFPEPHRSRSVETGHLYVTSGTYVSTIKVLTYLEFYE